MSPLITLVHHLKGKIALFFPKAIVGVEFSEVKFICAESNHKQFYGTSIV